MTTTARRTVIGNVLWKRRSRGPARSSAVPGELAAHRFATGDDVEHPAFGEGVIIDIRGQDDKAEATIRFRDVGTKHLALAWAPLKKL